MTGAPPSRSWDRLRTYAGPGDEGPPPFLPRARRETILRDPVPTISSVDATRGERRRDEKGRLPWLTCPWALSCSSDGLTDDVSQTASKEGDAARPA